MKKFLTVSVLTLVLAISAVSVSSVQNKAFAMFKGGYEW